MSKPNAIAISSDTCQPSGEAGSLTTKLWTYADLSAVTGLAEVTLRKWKRAGKIEACKGTGRAVRFDPQDVMRRLKHGDAE